MEFETQRALLEYAWRNPNDRSLVQRWIAKGIVWRTEEWMWHLEESRESLLEKEVKELKEKLKKSDVVDSGGLGKYKEWLDQANKAYEDLEKEKKAEVDSITKRCWDYMYQHKCCPTQTYKEFEYWILGKEYADIQFDPSDLPF